MGYIYKTKPRVHQAASLRLSIKQPVWAHLHEQRTGKSKIIIDTAAYHYEASHQPRPKAAVMPQEAFEHGALDLSADPLGVDALLIIAMPSGVPGQWVRDEIPKHLPDRIPRYCVVWNASKASTKKFQRSLEELLTFKGLAVLAVNGEAIITPTFRKYALRFLNARRTMAVADETTLICKTSGIERHKVLRAIRKHPNCIIRRIADGTPYGESPMDMWAQFDFLDPRITGHDSFYTYKKHFAVLERHNAMRAKRGKGGNPVIDPQTGAPVYEPYEYDTIIGYRNLDELNKRIFAYADRVRRADVSDAPPKIYTKLRFDITPEQRRVYDEIEEKHQTLLRSGERITTQHVLTRYLRLQQVTSNILPTPDALKTCGTCHGTGAGPDMTPDGCETCEGLGVVVVAGPVRRIDKKNPRLDVFMDTRSVSKASTIVWCRFQSDIDDVIGAFKKAGRKPVQYDGRTTQVQKEQARTGFQDGTYTDVVGNARAGGRGLRLDRAEIVSFYSNQPSLITREQAEDRAEDVDRTFSTGVEDVIANDTKDEEIVDNLRAKRTVAQIVMQENRGKWI